jgi:ABC-type taurine transport system ATPase subunit
MRFETKGEQLEAIEDITLNIGEDEFFCLVGPSGCGKTTLLSIIAGFLQPTTGQVFLDGKPILGPGADRAVVFQQPVALLPWLSVAENVAFGPKMKGLGKQERSQLVEKYLKMVGLGEFRKRAIYELSGGMQQRVALCRVLANEPRVLLMDEPFGALDALTREKMQEEMLRLSRGSGKMVFFITHSVEEAVFLGTTVAVMSARPGRIIAKFDCDFGNTLGRGEIRAIKSDRDFVALREKVLKLIWDQEGDDRSDSKVAFERIALG